jgi:hypothetical protein
LKGKININCFLRSIKWFVGSGGLVMTVLQIHRSLVQSQTAPEQKKIHHYLPGDQKSEDEKWRFNFNFCAVYDFVSLFLQERALYVFGSEFQSDFESVILYFANKIVT